MDAFLNETISFIIKNKMLIRMSGLFCVFLKLLFISKKRFNDGIDVVGET